MELIPDAFESGAAYGSNFRLPPAMSFELARVNIFSGSLGGSRKVVLERQVFQGALLCL